MLFNSFVFLLLFLPAVLAGFMLARSIGRLAAVVFVAAASIVFYAWWNVHFVPLLVGSIAVNYALGRQIARSNRYRGYWLAFGVVANLLPLAWFKYATFFAGNFTMITGVSVYLPEILLPLAISFFTFQQIAYLTSSYSRKIGEHTLAEYALCVTFFPHLIAGPIINYRDVLPQIRRPDFGFIKSEDAAIGLTLLLLGLAKKILIADPIARWVGPGFAAVGIGDEITLIEAWTCALAYTLQLYFDFSGYSDMAIGMARIFGIRFPVNFASPYKSTSIIEFWRRWHITLSEFLREHLYIPLGGNRKGQLRTYVNIVLVMLLGGLWHGAGWNFVAWGALHGAYIVINHAWRRYVALSASYNFLAGMLTFLCVVVAWVFFRSESLPAALSMVASMAGANGIALPIEYAGRLGGLAGWLSDVGVRFDTMRFFEGRETLQALAIPLAIAFLAPNSQQFVGLSDATGGPRSWWPQFLMWRPTARNGVLAGVVFILILWDMERTSEFLYFRF